MFEVIFAYYDEEGVMVDYEIYGTFCEEKNAKAFVKSNWDSRDDVFGKWVVRESENF